VQSFPDLRHKPLLVDMIAETGNKTKVLYASIAGGHYLEIQDSPNFSHKRTLSTVVSCINLVAAGRYKAFIDTLSRTV
jgi:hypothetical protein